MILYSGSDYNIPDLEALEALRRCTVYTHTIYSVCFSLVVGLILYCSVYCYTVNCKDTETVMILDENNDNSCESPSTATNSHELRVILTSTLVPLLLIIAVLIGIIIIMLLRDKIKK